jgi:FixJ family two-component response regulator
MDHVPLRVVVVDDDPGVRRALSRLLRVSGHTVRTFASAEELLSAFRPTEADCLVVDIYLGGMNGLDLRAELGMLGPVPPMVFITAHNDAKVAAIRYEDVICLRKPFEEHTLLSAINQAVSEGRPAPRSIG